MAFAEAMAAIQTHVRAAEVLAAIGAKLGEASGRISPNDNLAAKLGAVLDRYEPGLLDGLEADDLAALYGYVRAGLRQMLHLVELPHDGAGGWTYDDPSILETQGRMSRMVTRLLAGFANSDPEFGERLSDGAEFLDVGSGVGWISLSMAQRWPTLHATGIDILTPALELARQNLEKAGLADRVRFRQQDVMDLEDVEAFDVIFIPVMFIPEGIVRDALRRLFRAMKPGGWLFAAGYRVPEDDRLAALNELRTTLSGGRVWQVPGTRLGRRRSRIYFLGRHCGRFSHPSLGSKAHIVERIEVATGG